MQFLHYSYTTPTLRIPTLLKTVVQLIFSISVFNQDTSLFV